MTFVTVEHLYLQGGQLRVLGEQDIVYRVAPDPSPVPPRAATRGPH